MMGARPVNRAEITRATLGNYNFGTVNEQNFTKGGTSPDAYLKSWGYDDYGELDWLPFNGTLPTRAATNGATSLFLGNDGRLWGMGYNGYSQLGTGNTVNQNLAIPIAENVVQMAQGGGHIVYLDTGGNLRGLGRNNVGQLGQADTANKTAAVLIDTSVTHMAAAGDWTYYVKAGALYQATTSGPSFLTTDVTKVFTGLRGDYFYITSSGELWGWGLNENGLLGVSGVRSFADRVMIDQNVAEAAVGWDFIVYRKTDGSLWGMGENDNNQIHGSSTVNVLSPVSIEASDVVEVVAGYDHVHYRKANNTVYSRGRNHLGQLGNGDFGNVTGSSVQVDSNVSALAAGGDDSLWITLTAGP
jgi:alpha-tubulin suppressor-like RCC1 family protein